MLWAAEKTGSFNLSRFGATVLMHRLCRRIDVIQCLVYRQFTKHDHLRNTQQGLAMRAFEQGCEVAEHDGGRGEGLAGVGQ